MSRKIAQINLVVYSPETTEGREELAQRVADAHAAAVNQRIKSLNCSTKQKMKLLDAIITSVKRRSSVPTFK